jgi:hypothetical protein
MAHTRAGHYLYEPSTGPLPVKEEDTGYKTVNSKIDVKTNKRWVMLPNPFVV